MAHSKKAQFKTEILTGDHKFDQHLVVGPDPQGTMTTGTGHSRSHVKPDSAEAKQQIKLTKEEQDIYDGKQGEVLAKLMKTVVAYGNAFGADKLVDLGGNPHSVLLFGSSPVKPIVDILNTCADAGLKTYAPYTMDPRPYDFDNVETDPEYQYKLQKLYSIQRELEMVHLRLGAKNNNYWSCTCYYKEVGNAPPEGTNLCWSESSAVNFANSGLGCRSNRNPGGIDVLCNILGKAPHFGLMTDEGRKAKWLIDVRLDKEPQWSLLGGAIGMKVMEDVPYITGISQWLDKGVTDHSIGKLKDMGATTWKTSRRRPSSRVATCSWMAIRLMSSTRPSSSGSSKITPINGLRKTPNPPGPLSAARTTRLSSFTSGGRKSARPWKSETRINSRCRSTCSARTWCAITSWMRIPSWR
jgi:hypothetical protein